MFRKLFLVLAAALAFVISATAADYLDAVSFGDASSEQSHNLTQTNSEIIHGGLGQSARRLLPLDPVSYDGGSVSFTLKVDPEQQNYLTVKLWGSDKGAASGRLILYLDGLQVGYRHEGDYDVLNQTDDEAIFQGRFLYQTVPLPPMRTHGKKEVQLRIAALGSMWPYGTNFSQKQHNLAVPSRGIYRAYTHTSTRFSPDTSEKQGAPVTPTVRPLNHSAPATSSPPPPRSGGEGRGEVALRVHGEVPTAGTRIGATNRQAPVAQASSPASAGGVSPPVPHSSAIRPSEPGDELLAQMKTTVNSRLTQLLENKAGNDAGGQNEMLLLAEAYDTPWTATYHDARAIAAIVREGDYFVRHASTDPANWVGAGPFGETIARLGHNPQLEKALDETIEVPAQLNSGLRNGHATASATFTVKMTRRHAWARLLRASVDGHRLHGRRFYTNQSMIVDYNIYAANRGLMLLDPAEALPEPQALRYLYEAVGLLPWLGNDTADGGSEKPYGMNYFQITRKGLSRELGYVGTYGETILKFCRDMAELSGDEKIRQQLIKIETTRMNFRYPSLDPDGYRVMKLASEIDARTAHFPVANGAYTGADVRELWWMEVPALTKDPVSVGAAQQCLEDNQYFYRLAQRAQDNDTLGMMRNIDDYATVKALPKSAFRLPMTDGQPDFVFSDEQDAVVALKHGDQRMFLNFYFRQEFGVSGATRILDITPTVMRIATVQSQFQVISSGQEWTRPDIIDFERSGGFPPPGQQIHQAWQGEKLPIAKRPDGAREPRYGTWGPFVGKAAFYSLRYGDYLFGVNTTETNTYSLPTPSGYAQAPDLVSGKTLDLTKEIKIGPLTTVVLYLGK